MQKQVGRNYKANTIMHEEKDTRCMLCLSNLFYTHDVVKQHLGYQQDKNVPTICAQCRSYNTVRIMNEFITSYYQDDWKTKSVIKFSKDSLGFENHCKDLFGNFIVNEYENDDGIDLQNINLPDNSYDIIIHIHVLEHVEDHKTAFKELIRILKPGGCMYWMVPSMYTENVTVDWGYPDPNKWDHYRQYGKDFQEIFSRWSSNLEAETKFHLCTDPVSLNKDYVCETIKGQNNV